MLGCNIQTSVVMESNIFLLKDLVSHTFNKKYWLACVIIYAPQPFDKTHIELNQATL